MINIRNKPKIGVVDYGVCNINSILKMLNLLEFEAFKISNIKQINQVSKIILPGIGSFDAGINNLKKNDMFFEIQRQVLNKGKYILGICLGMQLLVLKSEEGKLEGLKLIRGNCKKITLNANSKLKIPHMGWNYLSIIKQNKIVKDLPLPSRFYFTHSYHVTEIEKNNIISTVNYDLELVAIINKDNIFGTQFHPEKSHKYGLSLLKNFGDICD